MQKLAELFNDQLLLNSAKSHPRASPFKTVQLSIQTVEPPGESESNLLHPSPILGKGGQTVSLYAFMLVHVLNNGFRTNSYNPSTFPMTENWFYCTAQ